MRSSLQPANVVLTVFVLLLGAIGTLDFFLNFESNHCEMTWMFEWPEYIKLPKKPELRRRFPHYDLYAYGEGTYADDLKRGLYKGIPVLFIPGNAGSYRQVRSLGSVSMRMTDSLRLPFHFNYFAVDLNEEMSGLYGPVLREQRSFVATSIEYIAGLYERNGTPLKDLILVGHSMGGVIALSLLGMENFAHKALISTIVTQASPLIGPVVAADSDLVKTYSEIANIDVLFGKNVTVFSTGGGFRDILVPGRLTELPDLFKSNGLSTQTMGVPLAWASTDHLCHVWCRQIVKATVRSLIGSVDVATQRMDDDLAKRRAVFEHFFKTNYGLKQFTTASVKTANKLEHVELSFSEIKVKTGRFWWTNRLRSSTNSVLYLLNPARQEFSHAFLHTNHEDPDWLYLCHGTDLLVENSNISKAQCSSLSEQSRLLPPLYSNRKYAMIDLAKIATNSEFLAVLAPSRRSISTRVELFNMSNRTTRVPLITNSSLRSFPAGLFRLGVYALPEKTVFHRFVFEQFSSHLLALEVVLYTDQCDNSIGLKKNSSVLHFHVPGSSEDVFRLVDFKRNGSISLKLQYGAAAVEPELLVYLEPHCNYVLKVSVSVIESLGQVFRYYGIVVFSLIVGQLLTAWMLMLQMKCSFQKAIGSSGISNWVTVASLFCLFGCIYLSETTNFVDLLGVSSLKGNFFYSPSRFSVDTFCVITILTVFANGILTVFGYFYGLLVNIVKSVFSRVYGFTLGRGRLSRRFGYIVLILLQISALTLSLLYCGFVSIAVAYFSCMFWMVGEVETRRTNLFQSVRSATFPLLLLHVVVIGLNVPVLVSWLKVQPYTPSLPFLDLSVWYGLSLGLYWAIKWIWLLIYGEEYRFNVDGSSFLINAVGTSAFSVPLLCCVNLFRLKYVVVAVLIADLADTLRMERRQPTK